MRGHVAALLFAMLTPTWQQTVDEMKVYWSEPWQHRIMRCTLNGTDLEVYRSGLGNPYGVAIDLPNAMIYWAVNKKIQRAHLSDLVTNEDWIAESEGLAFPGGLAIDETNRMLYWVDMTSDKVQRKSLDGGSIEDISSGESTPQGVAVDTSGGYVYWVSLGEGKVFARDMALSQPKIQVASGLSSPYGIVVDNINSKLYWSNRGSNLIQRWDLETWGSDPETFLTGLNGPMGLTIDVASETLYWLSRDTEMVNRIKLDGSGGVEDVVTAGDGYYLSVGFYAELEQTTSTTSSTATSGTRTSETTTSSTATSQTVSSTTDPLATTSTTYTSSRTTETDTTTTSRSTTLSSSTSTVSLTSSSTSQSATSSSSSTSVSSLSTSSTSTTSFTRSLTPTGTKTQTTSTSGSTTTSSFTGSSATSTQSSSTVSTTTTKTTTTTSSEGYLTITGSEITTSAASSQNLTGILATSATATTSFTRTSTFDESLIVAPLLLPEDDDVVTGGVIGTLVGLGAALIAGLFLLKKYGLLKLSLKSLRPSRLCSKWKTKVKSIPEETPFKGEAMQDARRSGGWPPQPDVPIPAVKGAEELLAKLQDFFARAHGATGTSGAPGDLAELLEQWKKSMAFGDAQVTIAEIVKDVLSDPLTVKGGDSIASLERIDPVVKNAWQKHVHSADQLPQEKRDELFEAGEDLIRIIRRTVDAKVDPSSVMKELVELRQEWRNRWPFEDAADATVAIQSIELAVTSAVIQMMHGSISSSGPEVSVVKMEVTDPHRMDTLPEDAADGSDAPQVEKSKSLKERLEELSSNSKQKTVEMKLRTAGDQLLVELSNVLDSAEAFPAEAVSTTVTSWSQRHVEQLPEAAANVTQMAQLARSVLSRAPNGKDMAMLRQLIEEAWKQGKVPEALGSHEATALPVEHPASMRSQEVLNASEELFARLETALESRSLEASQLEAFCEDWKIQQLKAQGVVVESDTGRLIEGLADFLKAGALGTSALSVSQVREALQVLKATEMLFQDLKSADPQDLEADLLRFTEGWKQKQLERFDGTDEVLKQWLESRVDAVQTVLKQEASSVDGMLGHVDIEKLRPQMQELWLESPAATIGQGSHSGYGDRVVDVIQSGQAFSQAREELFRELVGSTKPVEELVAAWQHDLVGQQVAGLTSGLGKVVMDASSVGQLKNVEVIWQKQMQKVLQDGGRLMKDLDNLLKSSFARLGEDLRPDITAECDAWTAQQLSAQKLTADSALAELYRGFVQVVHSVTLTAPEVAVAKADSSFQQLQVQIQDAWRQHMGDGSGSAEPSHSRGPARSERSEGVKNQEVEMHVEKVKPSKVLKDGEKLLGNLEDVFRCSWARPGEDLMPEIMKQCHEWTSRQVEAHGAHGAKAMYEGFSEAVQSVVQIHAVDGKVLGDAEFFQKLETDIKDTWKQRTKTQMAQVEVSSQHTVKSSEVKKDRVRAPKTERHGKSQAVQDAKQFLQQMEALFEHGPVEPKVIIQQGQAWRLERLEASKLTQDSEMGLWLQALIDTMDATLETTSGAVGAVEFAGLQAQIVEQWKHQLHGAQHVHFDSQASQGRGRSLPREATSSQSQSSKVDVAKEDLKIRLQALMQKNFEPQVLQQKVEELVQTWQKRQVTDDVDSITASLLQSLAQTAREMSSVSLAAVPANQVAPLFEEAWKAQQASAQEATRSTRSGRSSRSFREDERGASESQVETKKRTRSRPKEGRPPEAPKRGARSTERKPKESMDILDRLKDGNIEVAPEVDQLGDFVRSSMSLERGFQREPSRASPNSNSPHPSSRYGDFDMPSRGSSVHAEYRGHSPSPAPTPTADVLRLKYSRPARMAGASMVKVQR